MEEFVGELWDRFITGAAEKRHLGSAVKLDDISKTAAIFFRALGGDPGVSVSATCLLYTSPSPRDYAASRMPSSA